MATLTFEGGLNEQDITLVQDQECTLGYNFELGSRDTHFRPRKPFDNKGTATNAASINGYVQTDRCKKMGRFGINNAYDWIGGRSICEIRTRSSWEDVAVQCKGRERYAASSCGIGF